ncbi:MAG: single-stranded DNA-binding protein [Clostridiales bacterium]|nr:single-stranded DNA-binding protein [Clostridiales bacterium]
MADFYLNKVTIGGKLTKDPMLEVTMSGVYMTTFNVAISRKKGTYEKRPTFVRVAAFGHAAEFIVRHFRKGTSVCVVGSLSSRFWIDRNGMRQQVTEIHAEEVFPVGTPPFTAQLPLEENGGR